MRNRNFIKIIGIGSAALALAAPTAATAAGSPSYSPLVSLSMVAGPQSQTALCAVSSAGAASATEAATQAPPAQGCVLPVPDAAVAPLPSQPLPPTGFSPLLVGIGAIGLGVLLYALLHDDDNERPPEPESPM